MKLLITCSRASYYIGGTEVVSLHQAIELARLGHEIDYVVRDITTPSEYFSDFLNTVERESLPITIHYVTVDAPFGDGKSWIKWNQEALSFAIAALPLYLTLRPKIDLFVAHLVTDSIGIPLKSRFVLHLHGSPQQTDMLIDSAMGRVSHIIAHSDSILAWWRQHYNTTSYYTFRNGVEGDTFYAPPTKPRTIDVLYVGRFLEHKGILDILDAVHGSHRVVIAGRGPLESEIQQIIERRGLLNVTVLNSPSNDTLVELYRDAKVFICPSHAKEGVLTTMLEASAAGCAIVTSRGSGMTDVARDGINSIIVEPKDVEGISAALHTLLTDDKKRLHYATQFQNEILANWSWKSKGRELESIYDEIIHRF